jgi:hypothetical protein
VFLASIPPIAGASIIGALNVGSKKRDRVTDQEREILLAIGREPGDNYITDGCRKRSNKTAGIRRLINSVTFDSSLRPVFLVVPPSSG